jgi:hypothetical protein
LRNDGSSGKPESLRRKGREKRDSQEGRKRDKATMATAIVKSIYVALMVYKAFSHNFFHLIFTAAL